MKALILASQSPRRKSLLTQLGYTFSCQPANIDESVFDNESANDYVSRLALAKAKAVAMQLPSSTQSVVLGSDTSVIYHGKILGKPTDFEDFKAMMAMLSGDTHQVLTAIAIVSGDNSAVELVTTDVTFKQLSSKEISDYWQTSEPCDKAGGYGIQGIGGKFVTNINGSYSAVVGLPLYETNEMLKRFQIELNSNCTP